MTVKKSDFFLVLKDGEDSAMSLKTQAFFLFLFDWGWLSDKHENFAVFSFVNWVMRINRWAWKRQRFFVFKSWWELSWAKKPQQFSICLKLIRRIKQWVWNFQGFVSRFNWKMRIWHWQISAFFLVVHFWGGLSDERKNFSVLSCFICLQKMKRCERTTQHFFLIHVIRKN